MKRLARRPSAPVSMALGTLASRATGLLRTSVLAGLLGVGTVSDAYNAASAVPTMLLVLVTGGTLSAALVPLLSRAEDDTRLRQAVSTVFTALGLLAGAASLVLALAAPLVARLLTLGASGSADQTERLRLVTVLLVLFAPQVLLLALTAAASAVLTERGRLAELGWAPVGANVAFLLLLLAYPLARDDAGSAGAVPLPALLALGAASTGAAAVGCVLQLRALRDVLPTARELRRRPQRDVLRRLRATGGWTLIYAVSNQVGLVAVLSIGAGQPGAVSAYTWSFTVMQLPHALVAVTVLSATLPRLARAAGDPPAFQAQVRTTTTAVLLLLVPAAVAMALFADLAGSLLVGRGAGAGAGELLVGHGVRLFAVALVPFTVFQILTRTCYALDRPAWPAVVNVASNLVLVAGAVLAGDAGTPADLLTGLVLGYAASYVVGCLLLAALLRRRAGTPVELPLGPLAPVLAGALVGAAAVLFLRSALIGGWPATAAELLAYLVLAGAGVARRRSDLRLRVRTA